MSTEENGSKKLQKNNKKKFVIKQILVWINTYCNNKQPVAEVKGSVSKAIWIKLFLTVSGDPVEYLKFANPINRNQKFPFEKKEEKFWLFLNST